MNDLDHCLGMLRDAPVDSRLDGIEGAVMSGLGRRIEARVARRGMVLAGCVAIVVGFAGALAPSRPAQAAPLFGVPADAPSHLLGG